ncbi:DUF4232 domain-containing protein [Streptomyces sp. NBC_00320]|uniref:DUF4232 domain-containing protein n=1 Tax=Streptomyces sp. NBC_00320 TaxID=2975711 RepID=UPI002256670B|nr:DUF4232 domain-containing protein [Streptomyces sp. NBC_00320]MCX5151045.1 DUF4232 domain-containing protein [Streptomyces sp. NBC_00320]
MTAFRSTPATNSARPSRARASRRVVGAAVAALAALALTACQNGTGIKDGGAVAASEFATATPSATGGTGNAQGSPAPGPAAPTGGAKSTGGAKTGSGQGDAKGSADPSAAGNRVLCNGSNTDVTVQTVPRPLNHMLITVKNTGSKVCDLPYHPELRFDEMQWAPTAQEGTRPQAVVSLAPGESGYAAAVLSAADGSGEGGTTAHRLTIAFQGRTPHSSGGASATPSLPAAGVHYDSSLTVTYWQRDIEDALGS